MRIVGFHGKSGVGKDTFADHLVHYHGFVKVGFADEFKRFCKAIFPAISEKQLFGPSELRNEYVSTELCKDWREMAHEFVDRLPILDVDRDTALVTLSFWVEGLAARVFVCLREILQTLGSEWGRSISPTLWADDVFDRQVPEMESPAWFGWSTSTVRRRPSTPIVYPQNVERFGVQGIVIADIRFLNELECMRRSNTKSLAIKLCRGSQGTLSAGLPGHVSEAGIPDEHFDLVVDLPEGLQKARFLYEAIVSTFLT
jgi:hypothetical protein